MREVLLVDFIDGHEIGHIGQEDGCLVRSRRVSAISDILPAPPHHNRSSYSVEADRQSWEPPSKFGMACERNSGETNLHHPAQRTSCLGQYRLDGFTACLRFILNIAFHECSIGSRRDLARDKDEAAGVNGLSLISIEDALVLDDRGYIRVFSGRAACHAIDHLNA